VPWSRFGPPGDRWRLPVRSTAAASPPPRATATARVVPRPGIVASDPTDRIVGPASVHGRHHGRSTGVELDLGLRDAQTPANLTVRVESATSGGDPSGTVLASVDIPTTSIPAGDDPSGLTATFATPVPVSEGVVYAITLPELPQQDVTLWLAWQMDRSDPGGCTAYDATDHAGGDALASTG
jgi:hypothetical protein